MRKILAIGFIIVGTVISCKKEEITPTKPIVAIGKDCNCNRVVKVTYWNITGVGPQYDCYLINDCTEVQTFKTYSNKVVVGECKK